MATIQELIPGTLVICSTRMPYHVQPWIHGFHIGTIQEPGTVPTEWNGYNSEKYYCELTGTIPVKYEFGVQHDRIEQLIVITPEQAALSHADKLSLFMGEETRQNYERANKLSR